MQENPYTRTVISLPARIAVFLFVSITVLTLDITTKRIFFTEAFSGQPIIEGVLDFILHYNEGISFNIPIPKEIILFMTAFVLAGVLYLIFRNKNLRPLTLVGLALIFGGAIGNAYDRITLSFVRDWLLLFARSAINLADASIMLGMLLFLFSAKDQEVDKKEPIA